VKALDNIKRIRKDKGISQKIMADKLSIHVINYGKIENGTTALTIDRLYKIAGILGVGVAEILDEQTDIAKENIALKNENENLKISALLIEHDRNKIEMAIENWDELKSLRQVVTAIEYLDYIDIQSFKHDNGKYFPLSLNYQFLYISEFLKFFLRIGKNNVLHRLRKHIDIEKFKDSDLILEESKNTGRSVEQLLNELKKIRE